MKLQNARTLLKEFYFVGCAKRIDWKKSIFQEIENEGIVFIDEIDKISNSNVNWKSCRTDLHPEAGILAVKVSREICCRS